MLLKKNKKDQCLNEIAYRMPEMLRYAGINISARSQSQLTTMVQEHVKFMYFPSTADNIAKAIAFPVAIFVMAFSPYAVSIDKDCGNHELTSIPYEKTKQLDQIIYEKILVNYRDYELEAEYANKKEAHKNHDAPLIFSKPDPKEDKLAKDKEESDRELEELEERIKELKENRWFPSLGF